MSTGIPLGPGREFDAIRSLVAQWGARAHDIGDDAAVLHVPDGTQLVVSTDTSVEHVHFRREWMTPREIAWRATMAALSDLAAMGARPIGVLSALVVPPSWRDDLGALGEGIGDAADAAGCCVVGGDMAAGTELSLGITVLGTAVTPLRRTGARDGDAVWVTGTFGGPAAALRAWLSGERPPVAARARFARPVARVPHGMWFAEHGATAAVDISDGLVADARHIAAASGVAITLTLDALPLVPGVTPAQAAVSGEEYELLVTAPPSLAADAFELAFNVPLTRIGVVRRGEPGVTVTHCGALVDIAGGFDHFSA